MTPGPGPRNCLTDVAGIAIGHATDLALASGVTAVLFEAPAVAAVSVLGGAPGGRELGLLAADMTVERIDALVLSGGSAFGLDAAGGVQAMLREMGRGLPAGGARVPLVPQAILFDLGNGGDKAWGRFSPYRDLGYAAARAATAAAAAPLGSVGAGTGATTATVQGGLGAASMITTTGHMVAALVAVNALGAPTIGDGRHFWAAPFEVAAEFGGLGWPASMDAATTLRLKRPAQPGTTIGIVATDAVLTKAQAARLAVTAQDGLARAILPAHLPMDGDTIFAAATGRHALDGPAVLAALCHAATLVLARAVARGVYAARTLPHAGAQASWHELFRG